MSFLRNILSRRALWGLLVLVAAGVAAWQAIPPGVVPRTRAVGAAGPQPPGQLLASLKARLPAALAASRDVLLGTGRPVAWRRTTHDPRAEIYPVNPTGGPGGRMLARTGSPPKSVLELYRRQQQDLREYFRQLQQRNRAAAAALAPARTDARRLAAALAATAPSVPASPAGPAVDESTWPGRCLGRILAAAQNGDLPAARRWADELAAALAGLEDLHRWVDTLTAADLAALDFQARCWVAFTWADRRNDPAFLDVMDNLPTCWLLAAKAHNYFAVERLAAGWLKPPAAPAAPSAATPAAVHLPPALRGAFGDLHTRLTAPMRRLLDDAAAAPFESSYLANTLARAHASGSVVHLAAVLRRLGQVRPNATVTDAMDVIFYRAGDVTTCVSPADRYDQRLLVTAGRVAGPDRKALADALGAVHRLLGGWRNYGGQARTRKEALDSGQIDCISGSALLGAIYHNAGRGRGFPVRIACGSAGHTLFAAETAPGRLDLADCLTGKVLPDGWPGAFFQGLSWPENYPGPRGPAFSAELAARGLDNYVFAAGYVIRGPHAGECVRTALPYLPGRTRGGLSRVYPGPYPQANPPITE